MTEKEQAFCIIEIGTTFGTIKPQKTLAFADEARCIKNEGLCDMRLKISIENERHNRKSTMLHSIELKQVQGNKTIKSCIIIIYADKKISSVNLLCPDSVTFSSYKAKFDKLGFIQALRKSGTNRPRGYTRRSSKTDANRGGKDKRTRKPLPLVRRNHW